MNNSDSVLKAIQFKRTSAIEYANQKLKKEKKNNSTKRIKEQKKNLSKTNNFMMIKRWIKNNGICNEIHVI